MLISYVIIIEEKKRKLYKYKIVIAQKKFYLAKDIILNFLFHVSLFALLCVCT